MADTSENDVIEHIANQIDQIARSIYTEHSDWLAAKDEMDGKAGELGNKRMTLCSNIAKLADEGEWSDEHIKSAIKMATARIAGNTPSDDKTSKAMQVFVSQVSLAAHEAVRGQWDTMTSVLAKAWDAEQEQAKVDKKAGRDADTPIKKFVSRPYELVLRAAREVIKPAEYGRKITDPSDRLTLRTPADVTHWARVNDPDMDATKVASKLESMIKQLKAMATIFADSDQHDLHVAARVLTPWVGSGDTKGTKLRMSKARADAARAKPNVSTPATTPPTVDTPVATPASEPLAGVADIESLMNDTAQLLAA